MIAPLRALAILSVVVRLLARQLNYPLVAVTLPLFWLETPMTTMVPLQFPVPRLVVVPHVLVMVRESLTVGTTFLARSRLWKVPTVLLLAV